MGEISSYIALLVLSIWADNNKNAYNPCAGYKHFYSTFLFFSILGIISQNTAKLHSLLLYNSMIIFCDCEGVLFPLCFLSY